jgi:DNA-binding NarL/FixJ family response regulator
MNETAADRRPIRVFLLDDHEIVRRGVKELLEAEPDIKVVGEAGTAAAALAGIPALRPDVAVLDVRLPDGDGVTVCRDIRSSVPEVACLMLTSFGDDEALFDAIMAGAAGYVLKQIRGTDLVGAVRAVASGESMLDPEAASRVMQRMRDQAQRSDPLAELTPQERRILELIGEGLTNRQIGERMYLAEKTVKNYVSALFAKLGMERRTQAAAYAARLFAGTSGQARDEPDNLPAGPAAVPPPRLGSGTRHSSAVPPLPAGLVRRVPPSWPARSARFARPLFRAAGFIPRPSSLTRSTRSAPASTSTSMCAAPACLATLDSASRSATRRWSAVPAGTCESRLPCIRSEGANPSRSVISSTIPAILDRTPGGSLWPRDCKVKIADRMSLIVSSSASTA